VNFTFLEVHERFERHSVYQLKRKTIKKAVVAETRIATNKNNNCLLSFFEVLKRLSKGCSKLALFKLLGLLSETSLKYSGIPICGTTLRKANWFELSVGQFENIGGKTTQCLTDEGKLSCWCESSGVSKNRGFHWKSEFYCRFSFKKVRSI